MKKYTEKELAELANGVFNDDKESPVVYADDNGTFRTPQQYEELKKKGQHIGFEFVFKNPNVTEAKTVALPAADPEADKKIEALEKEIERLNELKTVKGAQEQLDAKDKTIADLQSKLEAATKPADAAQ